MPYFFDLDKRVHEKKPIAFVTGAGSGLGLALAVELVRRGWKVIGSSRNPASIASNYPEIEFIAIDFSRVAELEGRCGFIRETYGKIDLLINNAGTGVMGPLEYTTREDLLRAFDANFFGPAEITRYCLPLLKAGKGKQIVFISSIASEFGLPYRGVYSATKAALDRYAETLQMELIRFGIKTSIIQPGDFRSDISGKRIMSGSGTNDYGDFPKIHEQINREVQLAMSAQEMAERILSKVLRNNPPRIARPAPLMQKMSVLLKRILPISQFQQLLLNHYKTK